MGERCLDGGEAGDHGSLSVRLSRRARNERAVYGNGAGKGKNREKRKPTSALTERDYHRGRTTNKIESRIATPSPNAWIGARV